MDKTTHKAIELSIVLPCLNEEATLGGCLTEIADVMAAWGEVSWECIVADNGSRDRSIEIAREHGVRCVRISPKGYGLALQGGIGAACGRWVIFLDADGTYCLEDLPRLYTETASAAAAMGIASRFGRHLPQGAMPLLHRHVGTPVLSWLIRRIYGGGVRDCNSGFRCLDRSKFLDWKVFAPGMEFASELLVGVLCAGGRVVEIPSSLRVATEHRMPALSTWRDGMRHLLVILSHAPKVFEFIGIASVTCSLTAQIVAAVVGPVKFGPVEVFEIHSQLLFLGIGLLGIQAYATGCFIVLSGERMRKPMKLTRFLIGLQPATLLFTIAVCCAFTTLTFLILVVFWSFQGFHGIDVANWIVLAFQLLFLPGLLAFVLLAVHLSKTGMNRISPRVEEMVEVGLPGRWRGRPAADALLGTESDCTPGSGESSPESFQPDRRSLG